MRANLPGALLTLLIWLLGSYLLRIFLGQSIGGTSIYGPLAAPIAMLIWLYIISLAILVGAAFNAPFGGVKQSGTATHKEQLGPTVMDFYTVSRTVWLGA